MRRMWKSLRRGLALVFVLLVVLIGLVAMLLDTEAGSRFVIHRIVASVPGSLYVDGIEGTLWRTLGLRELRYRNDAIDLGASEVRLAISWPDALAGSVELEFVAADEIVYRGLKVRPDGPQPLEIGMPSLPLSISVAQGAVESLRLSGGSNERVIERIRVTDAALAGTRITLRSGTAIIAQTEIDASRLSIDLAGEVPLQADLRWRHTGTGWSGSGTVAGTLGELSVTHRLAAPYAVNATGSIRLLHRTEPEFDLDLDWQRLAFGALDIDAGDVRVSGTLGAYDASGQLTIREPRIPDVAVDGRVSGNTRGLTSADLHLQTTQGKASVGGTLAWSPSIAAELSVQASDIEPAMLHESLTGLVGGSLRLNFADSTHWTIADAALSGTLNGSEFLASGGVAMADAQFRCTACKATLGRNRVTAEGTFGDGRLALRLAVDAPALQAAWEALDGSLAVNGRLEGAATAPRFTGTIEAAGLRYRDWSLESIKIDSRGTGLQSTDMTVAIGSLRRDTLLLGNFDGTLNGTQDDLAVSLDWDYADIVKVSARGHVARTDSGVTGSLTRATVDETYTGRWELAAPLTFRADPGTVEVDAHRWQAANGQLDVSAFRYSPEAIAAIATLRGWPLATANPFLPAEYALSGPADADIDLARTDGTWLGSIHWRQTNTALRVERPGEERFDLQVPAATIDAEFAAGGVTFQSTVRIDPGVTIGARANLQSLGPNPTIDARLSIDGDDWEWLSSVVPAIDNFGGDLSANLAASGPLLSPALTGEVSWRNGRVDIPALNVPLTEVNVTAVGAANGTATVNGTARAGNGAVEITGRAEEIMRDSRRLQLALSGNGAEIINWPEYRLWASPALTINGSAAGWTVRGDLTIPKAEIEVHDLPENAVMPSQDIVTAGADPGTEPPRTRYSGEANVHIEKGFHISAFGLNTHMAGDLVARKRADRDLTAEGKVSLIDGDFDAYGQRLSIEEGTLTFTGPLDDPIVDVRAIRRIENFEDTIIAGIRLRGRAKNLTATVYSEPAMSEADALSYLMIGRPLAEATSAEGGELSTAAVGLGIRQASRLTQQIGQSVGLDQLSIIGDGGDATALVAGKQINQRLYARYAYGVFSQLGMIMIRYKLSARLSLEAGAGETQSIDILYTVDKE